MSASAAAATGAAVSQSAGVEGQYCFLVEYFDAQAAMMRQYHLLYFLLDDTIELFDLKNRRTFLKRCSYPSLKLSDLYIGAQVSVYSRLLKVLDYGDRFTRSKLAVEKGRTIAVVKPAGYSSWGRVLTAIARNGFKLGRVKSVQLSPAQAQNFYGDQQPSQRAHELAQGPILALEIIGAGVQQALLDASTSSSGGADARELTSVLRSHVHVATSERSADSELEFLFNNREIPSTATFTNCSLALIRPHAVQAGHAGAILDAILQDGFDVSALELFTLDKGAAEEFLEVYKGVLPEYYATIEQLTSGPLIAMEIRAPQRRLQQTTEDGRPVTQSVVAALRQLVGPADPEVAKHIRPRTLRAVFGQNKVKNAVHCTDLDEDGVLESSFFFNIMQQQVVPTTAAMQAAMQRR